MSEKDYQRGLNIITGFPMGFHQVYILQSYVQMVSIRDHAWSDDWVAIIFDTFNDERRTYNFFCNPLGVQSDQIQSSYGHGGSWDGIWNSAGRITEEGYIVEMAIPF